MVVLLGAGGLATVPAAAYPVVPELSGLGLKDTARNK